MALSSVGRDTRSAENPPPDLPPAPQEAPRQKSAREFILALDPGHPSERNSGRTVQNGTTEVRICWQVAVRLRDLLRERGVRVVMTKAAEGEYVTNRERAMIANRARADLFLRLHCDTATGRGYNIYYPGRQGTAQGKTGPSPAVIAASRRAADLFHQGFSRKIGRDLRDKGVRTDAETFVGRQQGALTGSIFSEVPALTVEMCVLSDPHDAAFVKSEEGQKKLAAALAEGVRAYAAARN
jgi:N-acetylmuramoyl-L-alanine amidase